jgi:hypothetical protein
VSISDTVISGLILKLSLYNNDIMSALLCQATLLFYSSSQIDANRPGPRPKAPTTLSAAASAALIYRARNRC